MAEKKVFDISPATKPKTLTPLNIPAGRMIPAPEPAQTASAEEPALNSHHTSTILPPQAPSVATSEVVSEEVKRPPDPGAVTAIAPPPTTDDKQLPPQAIQQVPKIFDTTKYQLPIQKRSQLSGGRFMLQFIIVCTVIVLIVAILAIDAGWLEVGVSLPFDLL